MEATETCAAHFVETKDGVLPNPVPGRVRCSSSAAVEALMRQHKSHTMIVVSHRRWCVVSCHRK